jgi:lipopolysaccharide/colanic/teichoic acid biosynthesis glycosyltransferase
MEVRTLPTPINTLLFDNKVRPFKHEAQAQTARLRRHGSSPVEFLAVLPRHTIYLACKSVLDRMVAAVLLIAAAPVIAILAVLVKLTSRGPAFYTQTRVGKQGRHFTIYKIRTMVNNCESLTGPRWSIPGDPRVTGLGKFLRLTHLDELPQLVNVLRGDMSLIGPRPERPEFLPELIQAYPAYPERLRIRPGVTGFAQVQLPADSDLEGVGRKLAYDLFYVEQANPWLDLRILLATALYVARVPYQTLGWLIGLPGPETVEDQIQAPMAARLRHRLSA